MQCHFIVALAFVISLAIFRDDARPQLHFEAAYKRFMIWMVAIYWIFDMHSVLLIFRSYSLGYWNHFDKSGLVVISLFLCNLRYDLRTHLDANSMFMIIKTKQTISSYIHSVEIDFVFKHLICSIFYGITRALLSTYMSPYIYKDSIINLRRSVLGL